MDFPHLTAGVFVRRVNRFAALVSVSGADVLAHVANSGRLEELLAPGNPVLLTPIVGLEERKTHFDLTLVRIDGAWVSADARVPPALVREAFLERRLPPFTLYTALRQEVPLGASRIDLLLAPRDAAGLGGPDGACYVEVKSCTLVKGGDALFPDAPTLRGARHARELANAVKRGFRAAVVFVVQRPDARRFRPNDAADPAFGEALRAAVSSGVEAYAYSCRVTPESIAINAPLEVCL